jgi:hypothetical protein
MPEQRGKPLALTLLAGLSAYSVERTLSLPQVNSKRTMQTIRYLGTVMPIHARTTLTNIGIYILDSLLAFRS